MSGYLPVASQQHTFVTATAQLLHLHDMAKNIQTYFTY